VEVDTVKPAIKRVFENAWIVFPVAVMLLFAAIIALVHIPLAALAFTESNQLYHHYRKKRDAADFPRLEKALCGEIARLDSVNAHLTARFRQQDGGTLVDALYGWADSAGFTTEKVEVGASQQAGDCVETPTSIRGSGAYRSAGRLVERVENYHQSTRIRQLTVSAQESGDPGVFIDVVVRIPQAAGKRP
jgi:hypothetical protein